MSKKTTLSIIGPGKVGTTLACLAYHSQCYNIVIGGRNKTKTKTAAEYIGKGVTGVDIQTAASMGDIVLLTVADDAIHSVCEQLSQAPSFKKGAIVAHCSGALNSEELLPAKKTCGAHLASLHPLQTFPTIENTLKQLKGSYCYHEGDIETKASVKQFISDIGMRAIEIQKQAKTLYHASAVVACNYLTTLMDASLEIGEAAGIDRDILWQSLEPLISTTLDNIKNKGPQQALTGPIARGDVKTIQRHKQALTALPSEQAERLSQVYSAMGIQTAYLAKKKGAITQKTKNLLCEHTFNDIRSFENKEIGT